MIEKKINYAGVEPFECIIHYVESNAFSNENQFESHIHNQCEIYINITGNGSFMVENNVYPISAGSVIITRPYEYHHCIYHSNAVHKHFWILFSAEKNELLFELFFKREAGERNLIVLPPEKLREIIEICRDMMKNETNHIKKYADFFALILLLEGKKSEDTAVEMQKLPVDVEFAVKYINDNISSQITINFLAARAHVSVNTLERHFSETLSMPPSVYLKNKRLANAAQLLKSGKSVMESCEKSGFSDYSRFISEFKKKFGATPLKFQKSINISENNN